MNEFGSLFERKHHAALVCLSSSCDVEGSAMIDRGTDYGQTDSDIHAGFDTKHFDRAVPLVMVHCNDYIEVAAAGAEKQGVRREWSLHVPAASATGADGGLNFRFLF